jgi:hypothetical protein
MVSVLRALPQQQCAGSGLATDDRLANKLHLLYSHSALRAPFSDASCTLTTIWVHLIANQAHSYLTTRGGKSGRNHCSPFHFHITDAN